MITKFKLEDLNKLNNLLDEFNYHFTPDNFNNEFINLLVYDDYKGVLIYDYIYDRIEIEYIIVDKRYRQQGIATKLLNFMESQYSNCKNITLEVKKSNIPAINFYKKNGFVCGAIREKYYNDEDGILMIKNLGE